VRAAEAKAAKAAKALKKTTSKPASSSFIKPQTTPTQTPTTPTTRTKRVETAKVATVATVATVAPVPHSSWVALGSPVSSPVPVPAPVVAPVPVPAPVVAPVPVPASVPVSAPVSVSASSMLQMTHARQLLDCAAHEEQKLQFALTADAQLFALIKHLEEVTSGSNAPSLFRGAVTTGENSWNNTDPESVAAVASLRENLPAHWPRSSISSVPLEH